jgi:hypothetical protein
LKRRERVARGDTDAAWKSMVTATRCGGMKLPPLEYDAVHKFVEDLVGEVLHPKQVDSLAHAVVGALHADASSITAIGHAAVRACEVSEKHSNQPAVGCRPTVRPSCSCNR